MPNLRVFPLYSSQSIQIYRMNISDCEGRGASWFENIAISYYNHSFLFWFADVIPILSIHQKIREDGENLAAAFKTRD